MVEMTRWIYGGDVKCMYGEDLSGDKVYMVEM